MDQAGSNDVEAAAPGNNVSPSEHEVSPAVQSSLGSAAGPAAAAVASAPATVDLPLLALRDACLAMPHRPCPSDTPYWWNALLEVLLREDRGLTHTGMLIIAAGPSGYPISSSTAAGAITATSAAAATTSA
ncbi:unnamed protein product, partial [Laminaria digitata]